MAQAKPSAFQFNRQAAEAANLLFCHDYMDNWLNRGSLGDAWDLTEVAGGAFVDHAEGRVFDCDAVGYAKGPNGSGTVNYNDHALVFRFCDASPGSIVSANNQIFHTGRYSASPPVENKHLMVRIGTDRVRVVYRDDAGSTYNIDAMGTITADVVYTVILNVSAAGIELYLYDVDGTELDSASEANANDGIDWAEGWPWHFGASAKPEGGALDGKMLWQAFFGTTLDATARAAIATDIYAHGTAQAADLEVFTHNTPMSGRAKTDEVSVSMVAADTTSQMRARYGTTTALGSTSDVASASAIGDRLINAIGSLAAGTVYHLQIECRLSTETLWSPLSPIRQTKTAAVPGTTCRSIYWADPHISRELTDPGYDPDTRSRFAAFLSHIASPLADFYASLGDELVSMPGPWPDIASQADMDAWWARWRDFTAPVLTMRPFDMADSNHHCRCGYTMEPSAGDFRQRRSAISEKRYLLRRADGKNDVGHTWKGSETGEKVGGADEGNTNPLEDAYAISWGDALFVFITPFLHTRIGEATGPNDRSQWTLGSVQLAWLEAVLAASTARWKIVCAHHIVGSCDEMAYGRCGKEDILHAGHYMTDTGDGEGLHAKLEAGGVTHFLKGHDHLMSYGRVGSILYVTCPSPSKLLGGPGQEAYGYETDEFWRKDYGYLELEWSNLQFIVKLHHLEYDGSFNITDTVVATALPNAPSVLIRQAFELLVTNSPTFVASVAPDAPADHIHYGELAADNVEISLPVCWIHPLEELQLDKFAAGAGPRASGRITFSLITEVSDEHIDANGEIDYPAAARALDNLANQVGYELTVIAQTQGLAVTSIGLDGEPVFSTPQKRSFWGRQTGKSHCRQELVAEYGLEVGAVE